MAQKHNSDADRTAEPKKKRRVGFSSIDVGIDPKDCIKIFLVSCKEDVDSPDCFCLEPVDLGNFFEEDGKIYGYQGLKISIWISSISFHSYGDITFEKKSDGGKGVTDLKSALKDIFADTLVESKEDFLLTFSKETQFISSAVSNGEVLQHKASNGHIADSNTDLKVPSSETEVVRMVMGNMAAGHLYSRVVPLVLLLVDGSNPIDVTDSSWEMYVLIQKSMDQQGNREDRLLGFAAIYRFYHYPDSSRLRLGQILILPPFQHKGYGRRLLEVLNNVAISDNVYDLTIEEPLEYLQHVRTCIDILRTLHFDPVQGAVSLTVSKLKHGKLSKKTSIPRLLPPASVVEEVRKSFKINKKQFLQCWEILIYLGLDRDDKCMDDYFSIISNRVRTDILGKDTEIAGKKVIDVPSDYDPETSFIMFRTRSGGESNSAQVDGNQSQQEEQLKQLVDERIKEIKLVAEKVSKHRV